MKTMAERAAASCPSLGKTKMTVSGDECQTGVVSGFECSQAVTSSVHQAASLAQIVCAESGADLHFVVLQKAGEKLRGNHGIVGEIGFGDELRAQTDGSAMQFIIGSAGELDKAPAFEALAIGRSEIAKVGARIVQVEGMPAG